MKFRALNFDYHADAAVRVLEDCESNRPQRHSSIVRLLPVVVTNNNKKASAAAVAVAAVAIASTAENNNEASSTSSSSLLLPAADCSSFSTSTMNDDEMNVNDHDDDDDNFGDHYAIMHDNDESVTVKDDMQDIEIEQPNEVQQQANEVHDADRSSINLLDLGPVSLSMSSSAAFFDYHDDASDHNGDDDDDDDDEEEEEEILVVHGNDGTAKKKLKKRRVIDDSDDDDDDDDDTTESLKHQPQPPSPLQQSVAQQHQQQHQQTVPPHHHHQQKQQQQQQQQDRQQQQQLQQQPVPPPPQQQQNQPVPTSHRHQEQQQQKQNDTKEMQMQWKQIIQTIIVATGRKRIANKIWHDVNKEILLTRKRSRHCLVSPLEQQHVQVLLQGQTPLPLLPPLQVVLRANDNDRLCLVEQHLGHTLQIRRRNMNLSSLLQPATTQPISFSFSMLETLLGQEGGGSGRFAPLSWPSSLSKKRNIHCPLLPDDEEQQQQRSSMAIVPYFAGNKRKAESDADNVVCESSSVHQQQQAPPPSPPPLPQPWQFAIQLAMAALYHNVQPPAPLAESSSSSSSSLPPAVATSGGRQRKETEKPTAILENRNTAFVPPQGTTAITEMMERQHGDDVKANCHRKIQKTDHPSSPHTEQDGATTSTTTGEAKSCTATTHHHQESIMGFSPPNRQPQQQRPDIHIPEQEQGVSTTGDAMSCTATMHEASTELNDYSGGQQQDASNKHSSSNGCTSFQRYCKASKRTGPKHGGILREPATKPAEEPDSSIAAPEKFQDDDAEHEEIPNENNGSAEPPSEEQVSDGQESCWDGPKTTNTGRVSFSDFVQYARNNRPSDGAAIQMDATSTIPAEPLVKNGLENQPEQAEGSCGGGTKKERSHKQRDETKSERKERKRLKKEKRRLKNERKLERGRSRERSGDGPREKHKRRRLSHAKDPPAAAIASSGHNQSSQQEQQPALVPPQTGKDENKQNHQRASSKQPPPKLAAESGDNMTEKKDMGQADGLDVYARWTNVDDQLQRARKSLMAKPHDDKTSHNAANVPRGLVTAKTSTKLHHGASLKAPPPTVQQKVRGSALGSAGQSQPNPLVPWTAATSRSKAVTGRNADGPPNGAPPSHKEGGPKSKSIGQMTFPARKEAPVCSQQHPAQTTQEMPRSAAENSRIHIDDSGREVSEEHPLQRRENEQHQSSTFPQNSDANSLAPPDPFNSFQNTYGTTAPVIGQPSSCDRPTIYHLLEPVQVLCSESFLETWGRVVGDLSTGKWASPPVTEEEVPGLASDDFLGRRIELVDTPLVDHCGVDMELPNRCGILLYNVSELEGDQARSIILNLAKISSIGRYENLFVFLCYDTAPTSTTTRHVLQLQTAVIRQDDIAPTSTLFKTVSPRSLAAGLAETILSQVQGCCENDAILQAGITSDDLLRQRAQFLLSLLPSLCARGAIQCIQLARHLCMAEEENSAFGALFRNARLRQQIHLTATSDPSGAPEIHRDAMVQLSHALRVCISTKPGI